MTNVETRSIETWQDKTNNELNQLKKEMIERIVEKMKENNQNDVFLSSWKDLVVDYLLDEWEAKDKVNDFLLWIGINLLSSSADQLNDFREKIKNSNTKEDLEALEKSIIDNLNNSWNIKTQTWNHSSWGTTSSWSTSSESTDSSDAETLVDSAEVWEAKEVPLKKRKKRLFPEWVPTKEKEMKKYIKTIKVPIITADWKKEKIKLTIHKKLAKEYKAVFKEMYDKKIPVNPKQTGWFKWREVRGKEGTGIMSHHSYWSAVDVNYGVNGWKFGTTDKNSPYYNDQTMVNIWKKHGFYRWWDRKKTYDPMHFSYMNG